MTLIVGADYGSEILMIADTRVSVDEKYGIPPKDMLRKLVFIDFFQRRAVLGFSGNIYAIKKIIESVSRKAKYFKSSGSLKEDIQRWIEEAIKMERQRHHLQFMLCDFDATEKSHIYVYETKENGEVQLQLQGTINIVGPGGHPGRGKVAVIGSGSKLKRRIHETTLMSSGNPKKYKNFEAYSNVRALMATDIIAAEFEDIKSKDVGGPFVMARIRPNECIGPHYLWPDRVDSSDVQVTMDNEKTVLYKPSTNEKYILFSIHNYNDADFYQYDNASAGLK